MNILLYSLGFIYAQIISKEPIMALSSDVDTTVKPTPEEKAKFISSGTFGEPISDDQILDQIFHNVKTAFGTDGDTSGGAAAASTTKITKKKKDTDTGVKDVKDVPAEAKEEKKEAEVKEEKKDESDDTGEKDGKEEGGEEEKKEGDAGGEDKGETEEADDGKDEEKEDEEGGGDEQDKEEEKEDEGEEKEDEGEDKEEDNEADDGQDENEEDKEEEENKNDENNDEEEEAEDDGNEEEDDGEDDDEEDDEDDKLLRRNLGASGNGGSEEKVVPNEPMDKYDQAIEVTPNEEVTWDPEAMKTMQELSKIDYTQIKSNKEIHESNADEEEEKLKNEPKTEGEEEPIPVAINDDIYQARYDDVRKQMDLHGFKTAKHEVPPNFFSDVYEKRKYCRKFPDFELCKGPSIFELTLDYIKALASSLVLVIYVGFFLVLCFLFFFRLKLYYSELSNAISNGYMEFYEKQNPIMVITKLERKKLESIKFRYLNSKRAEKKKGFFKSLFSKKKKPEEEKEKKPPGKPKIKEEPLDTFDGRQYEINNKNLTPVVVSFDVMDKKFIDLCNYIEDEIEQDILYYELEIEMLLGSTEIILGSLPPPEGP